uniref:NUC153 domain-containing protein n=1 Tax=Plectus sambesii TaxID=2011161 RepID=A0A914UQT1_9BILA
MVENLAKKSKNKKMPKNKSEKSTNGLSDPRFEHVSQDPKFRMMARKERKVAVDKRFAGMFNEPKFRLEYTVDKRGRPMRKTTDDHLKHLYELSSDEEKEVEEEKEEGDEDEPEKTSPSRKSESKVKKNDKAKSTKNIKKAPDQQAASSSDEQDDDDEVEDEDDDDMAIRLDLARGDGNISSSDDSESEWEFEEDEDVDHGWAELDKTARRTDDATSRLAVCNMDWDRVRAEDLLVLLNSFKPEGGVVRKVTVYPSEFGKERMAQEDLSGPIIKPIVSKKNAKKKVGDESDDDEQDDDYGEKLSRDQIEAMRNYQLDRLKYYYAVVECDSVATASKIYDECDGMEYEASAVRLDLRFVPEEMEFDEKARDEAIVDALNVDKYKPRVWETDALQKSNVKLTWDQTDPERIKATRAAFDPNADVDQFQDLIAPASSDEDAASDDEGERYGTLLEAAGLDRQRDSKGKSRVRDEDGMEMEISWESGLPSASGESKKQKSKDELTPWQQYLEKRKEKKRQHKASIKEKRRAAKLENEGESDDEEQEKPLPVASMDDGESAQLDLLLADERDDINSSKKHFNLKDLLKQQTEAGKKKKNKLKRPADSAEKQTVDEFEIDPDDNRFSAVYNSHLFNIDRSDPNYKPTTGMERLVAEKSKRKKTTDDVAPSLQDKKSAAVSNGVDTTLQLAKSLKKKTAQWENRKQNRTAAPADKKSKKS